MSASTWRRRSPSITIERRGSLEGCARCDGGSTPLGCGAGATPGNGDVRSGARAGIVAGDDRYAESSVTCVSVSDDTVARSCTPMRAQMRRAVAYEMP